MEKYKKFDKRNFGFYNCLPIPIGNIYLFFFSQRKNSFRSAEFHIKELYSYRVVMVLHTSGKVGGDGSGGLNFTHSQPNKTSETNLTTLSPGRHGDLP